MLHFCTFRLETVAKYIPEALCISSEDRILPSNMQLMARLMALLLLLWTVRASVLPEEKFGGQSSRELSRARKGLILKMLADLLDGAEVARRDMTAFSQSEDLPASELQGEQSELDPLSQITQRDRKAPCKNFFWKTFTAC